MRRGKYDRQLRRLFKRKGTMPEREIFIEPIRKRVPFYQKVANFFHSSTKAAALMLLAAIAALIVANTSLHEGFLEFWHTDFGFLFGDIQIEMSLAHIINDILMAVFFLLIGLEVKYEMLVGELKNIRQAILPIVAAAGGVIAPIIIYLAINSSNPDGIHGWGVPMATDIAFALGIMALLGSNVPKGIKVFLSTLAVADDIFAILVIALFYGESPQIPYLIAAALVMVVLILLNRAHVYSLKPYLLIGVVLWFCIFMSGIHSTIAGVLLAFAIPTRTQINLKSFVKWTNRKVDEFDEKYEPGEPLLGQAKAVQSVTQMSRLTKQAVPPSTRLEQTLYPWVYFLVLPLFALTNADVSFMEAGFDAILSNPVTFGVAFGLLFGKPIGIVLTSFILVKTKIASLPENVTWLHMIGAGILGGVGFTMAIFVANLAFTDPTNMVAAKVGILAASFIAGIAGFLFLYIEAKRSQRKYARETVRGEDIMPSDRELDSDDDPNN